MSHCNHCQTEIPKRSFYLNRNIEFERFRGIGDSFEEYVDNVEVIVLSSESINRFCSAGCADIGASQALHSLGLKILPPDIGPVATCAKCYGMVNLMEPHIAYDLMEATKFQKASHTHLKVHHDVSLCVVCKNCDGNLIEMELAQCAKTESKERV